MIDLTRGESSREKTRYEIQKFLLNGPARAKEIVEACDAAGATVYKYLDQLHIEDKIVWNPKRGRGKATYELSDKAKREIQKELLIREKTKKLGGLSIEELEQLDLETLFHLQNEILRIRKEKKDIQWEKMYQLIVGVWEESKG